MLGEIKYTNNSFDIVYKNQQTSDNIYNIRRYNKDIKA